MGYRPIARGQLPLDATLLAKSLIGRTLVRNNGEEVMSGRIVETECYLPDDPASHSFAGLTGRNKSMFLPRGFAYIYLIYGKWWCFNVSAGAKGDGAAVLIRALEPIHGIEAMIRRCGHLSSKDLARGPGRLCTALNIGPGLDGVDLCSYGPIFIAAGEGAKPEIGVSCRIGITRAVDAPLRFFARRSRFVSGPRALNEAT